MMNLLALAAFSFLVGLLTRLVDLKEDEGFGLPKGLSLTFGLLYGLIIGFVITIWPKTAALLGVLAAVAATKKIDAPGHYAGLLGFTASLLLLGIPKISPAPIALFLAAGALDEVADWFQEKRRMKRPLSTILSLRPFVEIAAFLYSLATGFWEIWIAMLAYDIAFVSFRWAKKQERTGG